MKMRSTPIALALALVAPMLGTGAEPVTSRTTSGAATMPRMKATRPASSLSA